MSTIWNMIGVFAYALFWPVWAIYFRIMPSRSRVLVLCGEEMLVVRGWLGNGRYILPGGGRHFNEPAIRSAVRELREEVAIEAPADSLQALGSAVVRTLGLRYKADYFVMRLDEKPAIRLARLELTDARWVPVGGSNPQVRLDTDVVRGLELLGKTSR